MSERRFYIVLDMDTLKVFAAGGVTVLILGAGVWTITQKDAETGEVLGEKTIQVAQGDATATPEPTAKPTETPVPATPKPTPKPVAALTLSAVAKTDGVYLSWKPFGSTDFKYYKIVSSKKNSDPRYPNDGYIHVSEDRMLSSYVDKSSYAGYTYYYRICAVAKSDGEVTCGNVASVKSLGGTPEEKYTPKPTPKLPAYTPVSDSLQLTTTKIEGGLVLNWTAYSGAGFNYYKVVRSKTNSDPYYPNDSYLAAIGDKGTTAYADESVDAGMSYYYRICAKVDELGVLCGNVVKVDF